MLVNSIFLLARYTSWISMVLHRVVSPAYAINCEFSAGWYVIKTDTGTRCLIMIVYQKQPHLFGHTECYMWGYLSNCPWAWLKSPLTTPTPQDRSTTSNCWWSNNEKSEQLIHKNPLQTDKLTETRSKTVVIITEAYRIHQVDLSARLQ